MSDVEDIVRSVLETQLAITPGRQAIDQREYALNRYREGARAASYLLGRYAKEIPASARILDVGGGNGCFVVPFAERGETRTFWIDRQHSVELSRVLAKTGLRIMRAIGDAGVLPIRSESIDVVLYIEAIEHVNARATGAEIQRVLRPGGLCYITSPPRLRFLLQSDPHYGIPGLLLLPDRLQERVFRRVRKGEPYEVEHIYWSTHGIMKTLPRLRAVEITSKHFAGPLRRFDWDWIIARKD